MGQHDGFWKAFWSLKEFSKYDFHYSSLEAQIEMSRFPYSWEAGKLI